jgi:spermidine/putrescine transport system substrate-binding protein
MIYMDWVYQPRVAAMLTEYINYITPVPDSRKVILQDAAAATSKDDKESLLQIANSPLVFPSPSEYSRLHRYRVLNTAEEKVWDGLFEPIYQS